MFYLTFGGGIFRLGLFDGTKLSLGSTHIIFAPQHTLIHILDPSIHFLLIQAAVFWTQLFIAIFLFLK